MNDYSEACWKKIREYFDEKFGEPSFKYSNKGTYYKYLDSENEIHIVSFFNDNQFNKSENDKDFNELHAFLSQQKASGDQIHIVCDTNIASVRYGNYVTYIKDDVNYYCLVDDLINDEPTSIIDITRLLQGLKKRQAKSKNQKPLRKVDDSDDTFSERSIMRDLENGEGGRHGLD